MHPVDLNAWCPATAVSEWRLFNFCYFHRLPTCIRVSCQAPRFPQYMLLSVSQPERHVLLFWTATIRVGYSGLSRGVSLYYWSIFHALVPIIDSWDSFRVTGQCDTRPWAFRDNCMNSWWPAVDMTHLRDLVHQGIPTFWITCNSQGQLGCWVVCNLYTRRCQYFSSGGCEMSRVQHRAYSSFFRLPSLFLYF